MRQKVVTKKQAASEEPPGASAYSEDLSDRDRWYGPYKNILSEKYLYLNSAVCTGENNMENT